MNAMFKIYLTIIALLPALIVFFIKNDINIFAYYLYFIWKYLIYFIILLLTNYFAILWSKGLGENNISKRSIVSIEQANDAFLPSYLGYFFVALSISNIEIFSLVFVLIGVLVFFSRSAYFNPIFLLFGFGFYYCTTNQGAKILIITKQKLKLPKNVSFECIRRINDFTFIDVRSSKNG